MKKPFLNLNTSGVTAAQSAAFHAAIAAVKSTRAPQYVSTGARKLAQFAPFLRIAAPDLTDEETVAAFAHLPNNPLAGLAPSTAKQYVATARVEFGILKNHRAF